jgi:hypothetical protein
MRIIIPNCYVLCIPIIILKKLKNKKTRKTRNRIIKGPTVHMHIETNI